MDVRVLPFKSTLFESFFGESVKDFNICSTCVNQLFYAPHSKDSRFYAWFGEMSFAKHFFWVLSAQKVEVISN